MRAAVLFALLAVAATAQTDDAPPLDRDAILAEARANAPSPDAEPGFVAAWADPGFGRGGGGGNYNEGTYGARGIYLSQVLQSAWTSRYPFQEDPVAPSIRRNLIDLPHSIERAQVDVRMVHPELTRETYGPALLAGLEDALALDISFEDRPTVVFALRAADGATPRFPDTDLDARTDLTMRSGDGSFFVRDATSFRLAKGLSGATGHLVVDEVGVDEPFDLELAFDTSDVDFEASVLPSRSMEALRARLREAHGLDLVPEVRAVEWMVVRERD